MQLSLDLLQADHVANTKFRQLRESTAYVTLSGCVLEHIVTTSALSSVEKLYYILVNSLSIINSQNSKQRSIALSAESWAKRLNCSKSQVFILQKSLSDKGYFIVSKDKNRYGQDKRNLICPTLPDSVFGELCNSNDRVGKEHLSFSAISESKLQYLDRTKLFIILSYQVLKDISACEYLTPFHKLVWLDFYSRCYKTHMANSGSVSGIGLSTLGFSFITSYQQLENRYSCDKRLLSVALIELEEIGLIKREHFYVKKEFGDQDRQDKSLWKISLLLPEQLNHDSGSGAKPGDSASFSASSNNESKMHTNAKVKIFSSANILPNVGLTLTLEQKQDFYIKEVITELEVDDNNELTEQKVIESDIITTVIGPGRNEPDSDKHSGVILPIVPEFQSFNIYNNINTISNIYKSNLDVVDNYSNSFINKSNINSSYNKTTECKDRFKNCSSNNMDGGDSAKNENKRVFKRGKFLKRKIHEKSKFNVCTSLIKEKLKLLSKDKADKARKFAYSLFSKNLAKGYAALITKHELAKQFIHHAATWKPTKINDYNGNGANSLADEQQIDIALSVAWNSVVKGTWQEPLEWKKAKALQYEYLEYKKKYQESGVISKEIQSLELVVNTLLGGAGGKEPGVDLGRVVENKKGKLAGSYNAYGYDLTWKIKQEVDRLEELEATSMVAGFTSYQGQIGNTNTIQYEEGTNYERPNSNKDLPPVKALEIENNICVEGRVNEKAFIDEEMFIGDGGASHLVDYEGTSYDNLLSNLEIIQSPIFKDLKELTTKYDDNGQQINFKVLDAKSLDGIGYDNSSSDVASNNCNQYLARLKLMEVNKFEDIAMILDSDNTEPDNNSTYPFEKKENSTLEVSLSPIGASCDNKQENLADDYLFASGYNNYNYYNEPINHQDDRILKDFIKIDNALANIFKNLRHKN